MLPAYALVGSLALWRMRTLERAREVLAAPRERLFLVWFLAVFALANHEAFIKNPYQPIHFTRGYEWMPLFLLGAPLLLSWFNEWRNRKTWLSWGAALLVTVVFLTDNAAWLAIKSATMARVYRYYSREEYDVLNYLATIPASEKRLVIPPYDDFGMQVTALTSLRVWCGHKSETPAMADKERTLKAWQEKGEFAADWENRQLLIVGENSADDASLKLARQRLEGRPTVQLLYRNDRFYVLSVH